MASLVNSIGLVIVLDEPVMPSLARLAVRRGWPVLEMATARQAVSVVLQQQAALHIVQVSVRGDEAADLIRLLRAAPRKVPIVAVSTLHDPCVERAAREAGADCYLPGVERLEVLEQMIESLAPEGTPDGRSRRCAVSG